VSDQRTAGVVEPAVVDSLDDHLALAGSIDRAALLPGMYLGWCARLGLVAPAFRVAHEQAILRLNYGEGSGVELLVSCGGTLHYEWLSAQGKTFTRHYYSRYLNDWQQVFGDDVYAVEDTWANYDRLAPVLTRALYNFNGEASKRNQVPKRRSRWKFWQ